MSATLEELEQKATSKSISVLNWCYGAYSPETNGDIVNNQIKLVHFYKNAMVELEHKRRAAADRAARAIHPPFDELAREYDAADAAVNEIIEMLKKRRAKAQQRLELTDEETAELRRRKDARSAAYKALKQEKDKAYKLLTAKQEEYRNEVMASFGYKEAFKDLDRKRKKEVKTKWLTSICEVELAPNAFLDAGEWANNEDGRRLRCSSQLYSGNYIIAERAFKRVREGAPPRFKSYDGSGSIGVQIPGGASLSDLISGKSTLVRLELPELTERMATKHKDRGKQAIGYCYLRVSSDVKRAPIWAKFPFIYSREFPKDARFQFVIVDRRRVGSVYHWQLRFETRTNFKVAQAPGNGKTVAVHLGYRMFEEGIRVAVLLDDSGKTENLILPNKLVERFLYVDALKSVQKKQFNMTIKAFWDWRKHFADKLPDWFLQKSEYAYNWNDTWRLASLVLHWGQNRFEGDTKLHPCLADLKQWADSNDPVSSRAMQDTATTFGLFRYWTSWNRHMVDWIANQYRKPSATRNQLYRSFAKRLRQSYDKVVLAKVDWKKLAQQEAPDEAVTQTNLQRHMARIASPGKLSEYLQERFTSDVTLVSEMKITKTCHRCGADQEWDRKLLMRQCTSCGVTWDQDINAVHNQMKRAMA